MDRYLKDLSELQKIGDEILEKLNRDNPYYEVNIDYIVEVHYDIRIEAAPLKWEFGIEGYPCLGGHKIFIDSTLINDDRQEREDNNGRFNPLFSLGLRRNKYEYKTGRN